MIRGHPHSICEAIAVRIAEIVVEFDDRVRAGKENLLGNAGGNGGTAQRHVEEVRHVQGRIAGVPDPHIRGSMPEVLAREEVNHGVVGLSATEPGDGGRIAQEHPLRERGERLGSQIARNSHGCSQVQEHLPGRHVPRGRGGGMRPAPPNDRASAGLIRQGELRAGWDLPGSAGSPWGLGVGEGAGDEGRESNSPRGAIKAYFEGHGVCRGAKVARVGDNLGAL